MILMSLQGPTLFRYYDCLPKCASSNCDSYSHASNHYSNSDGHCYCARDMLNHCTYLGLISILMLMNVGSCYWSSRRYSTFSYEQYQSHDGLRNECHERHECAYKHFDRNRHINR
jgi:hypothetical protein